MVFTDDWIAKMVALAHSMDDLTFQAGVLTASIVLLCVQSEAAGLQVGHTGE